MRSSLIWMAAALFIAGGVALFFLPGGGDEPAAATYSFDDWLVRCRAGKEKSACGMSQLLLDRRTGRAVMQLTLGAAPNGRNLLGVVVPLGVSVPDGVTLQIGDATRKFGYSQCLAGGCIASLQADDALIDKMKVPGDARLAVIDRTGRPVVMPVSLKGFAAAFDKMAARGGGGWLPFLRVSGS